MPVMTDQAAAPGPQSAPVYLLGLTMAGAISAGAYNAGAFDFLIEALEAWEQRKRKLREDGTPRECWDVPSHDVVIPVMSGASAGGITGALGLIALADQAQSLTLAVPGVGNVTTTLPRLYNAWVRSPCLVSGTGGADLLGTKDLDDLAPGQPAPALLDTSILRKNDPAWFLRKLLWLRKRRWIVISQSCCGSENDAGSLFPDRYLPGSLFPDHAGHGTHDRPAGRRPHGDLRRLPGDRRGAVSRRRTGRPPPCRRRCSTIRRRAVPGLPGSAAALAAAARRLPAT